MGRRVEKTVYAYASSTQSWELSTQSLFVYDGWNLIEELDGSQAVQKAYVWGLDLSQSTQGAGGVGGLIAAVDDSVTYLYSYDGNGNVGQVIDAADGSIGAHYEYDPYGNLLNQSGVYADENTYRFSSKYFDQETNLHYYGYRYYSSELGRWINRDPIGEKGGKNLYIFVDNNSINIIDYLGKKFGQLFRRWNFGGRDINPINRELRAWRSFFKEPSETNLPFAAGINAGGIIALKPDPVLPGIMVGKSTAMIFFPDSCEIAYYAVTAKFDTAKIDRYNTNGESEEVDAQIGLGYIHSLGTSIEAAVRLRSPIPGSADAESFLGKFHTFETMAVSPYIGETSADDLSTWVGGTAGYGLSKGAIFYIDWEYDWLTGSKDTSVIDFKTIPLFNECICNGLKKMLLGK